MLASPTPWEGPAKVNSSKVSSGQTSIPFSAASLLIGLTGGFEVKAEDDIENTSLPL